MAQFFTIMNHQEEQRICYKKLLKRFVKQSKKTKVLIGDIDQGIDWG